MVRYCSVRIVINSKYGRKSFSKVNNENGVLDIKSYPIRNERCALIHLPLKVHPAQQAH